MSKKDTSPNRKEKKNISDVGSYLKKVRMQNNMSTDKLALHTKIREDNIIAIENNDTISHIPHAYYRGYVKCYCLFFGIDAAEVLEMLPQHTYEIPKSSYSPVNTFQVKRSSENRDDSTSRQGSWIQGKWIALLTVIVVILGVGYQQIITQQEQSRQMMTEDNSQHGQIGSIIDIS